MFPVLCLWRGCEEITTCWIKEYFSHFVLYFLYQCTYRLAVLLYRTINNRMASSSLDALMDFMVTLQQSVTNALPLIDATSVSGRYIQSVCCLGFAELSFSETARLWNHFRSQVNEAIAAIETRETNNDARAAVCTKNFETKSRTNDEWSLSHDQMENLLRHECHRSGPMDELAMTEDGISHVLQDHPELPSAHFLRFLHCLRSKERVGAMDALHAYSDYVLIRRRHNHSSSSNTLTPGCGEENRNIALEHQQILQFAAILLAGLHYETGDVTLARLATDEAVRVAQQSHADATACVAYSLGWLSQTTTGASVFAAAASIASEEWGRNDSSLSYGNAREWMARCVERSVEGNLRSLVAGANLSRVRQLLENSLLLMSNRNRGLAGIGSPGSNAVVSGSSPSSPFAVVQTAWSLLSAAASTESTETAAASAHFNPPNDRPMNMMHLDHSQDALRILAQQRVLMAAVWDAYNQPSSSGLASFLALLLSSSPISHPSRPLQLKQGQPVHVDKMDRDMNEVDNCLLSPSYVATSIQNVARTALYGSEQTVLLGWYNCRSKERTVIKDSASTYDCDCVYGKAVLQISHLRRVFGVLPDDSSVIQETALILHEWAVRRGDLMDAQAWMRFMLSNIHPGMANNAQIQIDVRIQESLLLSAQKKWDEATHILKEQLHVCKMIGFPTQTAWVLLRLAYLLIQSSADNEMQQELLSNVVNALPFLFECLEVCDEHGMDGLHAVAMSVLAQVHVRMARYDSAIAIVEAVLPKVLQQGHVWFQAEVYLTLAKAYLMRLKRLNKADSVKKGKSLERVRNVSSLRTKQQESVLKMAIQALSQSEELFSRCQDGMKLKEVCYLKAHSWNMMPQATKEREEASQRFLAVSKYLGEAIRTRPSTVSFENALLAGDQLMKLDDLALRCYV